MCARRPRITSPDIRPTLKGSNFPLVSKSFNLTVPPADNDMGKDRGTNEGAQGQALAAALRRHVQILACDCESTIIC